MAIDFTFSPDVEQARERIGAFIQDEIETTEKRLIADDADRGEWRTALHALRDRAKEQGVWLPHMPPEWGGMGLGPTALAAVSAELARTTWGPYVVNCYAPDEGNMHTIMHWGTAEQKERYLRPLCEGTTRSCFAMTEPDVAGSDPTLMRTTAVQDGDDWVVNGRKWFISGARGARFAILLARTEEDPEVPQAATSAFLVDIPSDGWIDPLLGALLLVGAVGYALLEARAGTRALDRICKSHEALTAAIERTAGYQAGPLDFS